MGKSAIGSNLNFSLEDKAAIATGASAGLGNAKVGMYLHYPKILLTGKPGIGKTTLVRKIIEQMQPAPMIGFYTAEMRSEEKRCGFELRGLNGARRVLAHEDFKSRRLVGRYGVDTAGFEAFLEQLDLLHPNAGLIIIDEIGKMELFSKRFQSLIQELFDSNRQLIATIALHGGGFVQEIKQRPGVLLLEIMRDNRDHLLAEILGQR
jgi:nucleoside-triphosphatase